MTDFVNKFVNFVTGPIQIAPEILRIFPDGLILGVGFFALLTLSFSYGVFFLSLLESLLFFHGLRSSNSYLDLIGIRPTKAAADKRCRTGYMSASLESLSLFGNGPRFGFPSAPLFISSTAVAYVIGSMMEYTKELEIMGEEFSSRYYMTVIALPLFLLVLSLYRLSNGCDTIGTLVASIVFGLIAGTFLIFQNSRLFGQESLNLVGVPRLRSRTADGQPLYICPGCK